MVNIIIYLEEKSNVESLLSELLQAKLIATASVDFTNLQYELINGQVHTKTYNVVTLQTKSLLFREVCNVVVEKFGDSTRIISTPILSANMKFEEQIRFETKPT